MDFAAEFSRPHFPAVPGGQIGRQDVNARRRALQSVQSVYNASSARILGGLRALGGLTLGGGRTAAARTLQPAPACTAAAQLVTPARLEESLTHRTLKLSAT
eukprot:597940-Rhodomonas_salina.1